MTRTNARGLSGAVVAHPDQALAHGDRRRIRISGHRKARSFDHGCQMPGLHPHPLSFAFVDIKNHLPQFVLDKRAGRGLPRSADAGQAVGLHDDGIFVPAQHDTSTLARGDPAASRNVHLCAERFPVFAVQRIEGLRAHLDHEPVRGGRMR